MKKRPNLVLREPVKLYEQKREPELIEVNKREVEVDQKREIETLVVAEKEIEKLVVAEKEIEKLEKEEELTTKLIFKESIRGKLPPRIGQIWDYLCQKAKSDGELKRSFCLTRSEVMKGAGIGSTNTYRDALKRFQDLGLLEIELRPGVISGSVFTLTEKGVEQIGIE